ncbi:MAG TPA: ATP-binding protein [Burkholderiaceae bacterium]
MIDERAGTRPTIVTSQLLVEHWHAWIGDATIAGAILDRLLSRSNRLNLKGKSMRTSKLADAHAEDLDTATLQGDIAAYDDASNNASTTEPFDHLQTSASYKPFHATQHRTLKPVTFPKIAGHVRRNTVACETSRTRRLD